MKMLILLALMAFATTVFAAADPTKICLPDALQSELYSLTSEDYGYLAIDFKQEKLGVHYLRSGIRLVFNLTDFAGYIINTTANTCAQILAGSEINQVVTKCLPATAKPVGNDSTIGIAPNSLAFEAWEIDIGTGVTRVAFTKTNPVVPILREYKSGTTYDAVFYFNQQSTVTHPTIFAVPKDCAKPVIG